MIRSTLGVAFSTRTGDEKMMHTYSSIPKFGLDPSNLDHTSYIDCMARLPVMVV